MLIPLNQNLAKLPLPPSAAWPEGVWDVEAFARGSMSVILFTPRGNDYQTSHTQDELYVVLAGTGVLRVGTEARSFKAGDVLFVAANQQHRFEQFTEDLVTWAIFWGPAGGESPAGREPQVVQQPS